MEKKLNGRKIMVLVSNGVDETVMSTVQRELLKTGATVRTVGTEPGLVNSWNGTAWGLYFPVDQQISQTLGADFDCLVVPSGTRSVQKLAANPHAERIISSFTSTRKPLAFMGAAAELLDKIGFSGERENPCVFTGDSTDATAFIARMADHFAAAPEGIKVAA